MTQGRAEAAPGVLTADHAGQEQTADVSTPGELTADAAGRTPDPAARRPLLTPMAGGDVCSSTRMQAAPPTPNPKPNPNPNPNPNSIQVAYIMLPSAAQRALTPVNAPSDVALSWSGSADP